MWSKLVSNFKIQRVLTLATIDSYTYRKVYFCTSKLRYATHLFATSDY